MAAAKQYINKFFEFLPALCFVLTYSFYDAIAAIQALMVSAVVSLVVSWGLTKKVSKMQWVTTTLILVFGGLSLWSGNPSFIKMKVSILNLLWATILVLDILVFKKYFIKKLLGSQIKLPESAWRNLTISWSFFFIFCAILNEIVWNYFSEAFWVYFKVFGLASISIVFLLSSTLYMYAKYNKEDASYAPKVK